MVVLCKRLAPDVLHPANSATPLPDRFLMHLQGLQCAVPLGALSRKAACGRGGARRAGGPEAARRHGRSRRGCGGNRVRQRRPRAGPVRVLRAPCMPCEMLVCVCHGMHEMACRRSA